MTSFREFVEKLRKEKRAIGLKKPASLKLELASVMKELDGKAVYTDKIQEMPGAHAVGNVFSTRELVCEYLGVKRHHI